MAPTPVEDPDERVSDLYALAPEQFVDARNALAKDLRAHGDGDGAKQVARLRRPTVAAWALNQVARRHPDAMAEIGEVGDELRHAQRRALSGVGADELRRAGARRRKVVERIASRADDVLREAGRAAGATVHQQVTETLEAATTSEEVADALLRGRLEREVAADSGFGEVGALSLVPERAPAKTAKAEKQKATSTAAPARRSSRERDAARGRVEAAAAATQRAERDEKDAVEELEAAEHDADDAAAQVQDLERALHDARIELDAARNRVRGAKRERDAAQRATVKARRAEDDARAALDGLGTE